MAEEREVYVKCSTCKWEGTIRLGGEASIYDVTCPECGCRTLFFYYVFPVAGG